MATTSILALIVKETAETILSKGLAVARIVGLDVDSWETGDPTRSLYKYLAEVLAAYEGNVVEYIKAGFLSTAEGEWKTIVAKEVYNVNRVEATYATPTVTLRNDGAGYYSADSVGELIVQNTTTGRTYRNTSTGTLNPGDTLTFSLIADDAGSGSNAAVNEVDALVSAWIGVTVVSSTAAVASDQESDDALEARCLATTGALSPNGPPDAYEAVALDPDLTGVSDVTRARTIGDSDTGDVTLYVASASGAVAGASVTAVQDAVEKWATPECIKPTVINATTKQVHKTVTIEGDSIPAGFSSTITTALATEFSSYPISDGTEYVAASWLKAQIHEAVPQVRRVTFTDDSDISLAAGEIPVVGTISISEV